MRPSYCSYCGGKLLKESTKLYICTKCQKHIYLNPIPCNAVILENRQGEILLVKRKLPPFKNFWDLPGGFIDLEENVEKSLKREIREELGVEVTNLKYFHSYFDRYLYKGINYHTLGLVFTGKVKDQNLKPADDISEVKFFPPNKLPQKLAFRNVKQALKDYLGK